MDVKEEANQTARQFSAGPPQGKLAPEGLTSAAPSLPAQARTDGRAVASRSGTSSALHAVKSVGALNTLVEINQLRKSFGSHEVLKGIDLEVKAGEVIAIIGKSGSGKSTLLRCINGLEVFQSGTLRVDGKHLLHDNPHVMRDLRQRVGMIFQSFNLFPHLTVGKNIMLAPTLVKKTAGAPAQEQARALLQRVGLAEKFDAWPDQLSGGQQQRVAIARALAMQPSVLLCDEITSALDPELVGEVLQVVESLAADGMTLLMVTHEMNFARKVADRLVFMHQGRVHEIGPPDEVFSNPQTAELKQFLGMIQ